MVEKLAHTIFTFYLASKYKKAYIAYLEHHLTRLF